jgi:hypothetical protein
MSLSRHQPRPTRWRERDRRLKVIREFAVDGKLINQIRRLIEGAIAMRVEMQRPATLAMSGVRYSWLDRIAENDAAALAREFIPPRRSHQ